MSFKLYDCKVRLQGSVLNEVPKSGVTAPEIDILRALHGGDAVVGIVDTGEIARTVVSEKPLKVRPRSDKEERDRLVAMFANPATTVAESADKKMRMIRDLFGHDRNPLPKELDLAPAVVEDEDDEAAEAVPMAGKRTVVKEPSFAE